MRPLGTGLFGDRVGLINSDHVHLASQYDPRPPIECGITALVLGYNWGEFALDHEVFCHGRSTATHSRDGFGLGETGCE